MSRARWCWTVGLVSAGIVAQPPAYLAAQDPWVEPVRRTVVRIEVQKPSFADANVGFTTGMLYTTAAVRLSDRLQLALELPIANFSPDNGGDGDLRIGNPFVGLNVAPPSGTGGFAQGGIRLPVASFGDGGEALLVGALTDWDRFEAYLVDVLAITTSGGYRYASLEGVVLAGRGGFTYLVPTEGGGDGELVFNYGGRVGYDRNRVVLGAAVTGRFLLTSDEDDTDNHHLTFDAGYRFGSAMPYLGIRLPVSGPLVDDLNSVVIVGVRLGR